MYSRPFRATPMSAGVAKRDRPKVAVRPEAAVRYAFSKCRKWVKVPAIWQHRFRVREGAAACQVR